MSAVLAIRRVYPRRPPGAGSVARRDLIAGELDRLPAPLAFLLYGVDGKAELDHAVPLALGDRKPGGSGGDRRGVGGLDRDGDQAEAIERGGELDRIGARGQLLGRASADEDHP